MTVSGAVPRFPSAVSVTSWATCRKLLWKAAQCSRSIVAPFWGFLGGAAAYLVLRQTHQARDTGPVSAPSGK